MAAFCQKYSDSEEPISTIAKILSNNDTAKYKEILSKFEVLGFHKVKDLAQAPLEMVNQISLDGDPLVQLYSAIQAYDEICAERFKSAKSFYEKGNYVSCQEACEKLFALQPSDLNIALLLSSSYYMRSKHNKSLESLNKVAEKYCRSFEVIHNIAANYLKKNDYTEARDNYFLAITRNPEFIESWTGYIVTVIKMADYKKALTALHVMFHYCPKSHIYYILYGQVLIKLNEFSEALNYFIGAVDLEPKSEASWMALGDMYALLKKYKYAISCYEQCYEINKSEEAYINLGIMHFHLKNYDKTIYFLKTAIVMYPKENVYILPILGTAYLNVNNTFSAKKTFSLCEKLQPNNPDVLNQIGLIYLNNFDNAAAAEPYFKSCVDSDKTNVVYYNHLTIVYKLLNKENLAFKTALKWAETCTCKNDDLGETTELNYINDQIVYNYFCYWKLGLMLFNAGIHHEVLLRCVEKRELRFNFFYTLSSVAFKYEERNQLKDAEQYYEKALELYPKHYDTIINLILIKQRRGLIDDVIGLYDFMLKQRISDSFVIHTALANYFYKEVGNLKEAYNHYLKASEICDNDFDTYLALGILSLELNNKNTALNYFRKVLELNSDCIIARTYVGYICENSEQFDDAIHEFKMVLDLQPNDPDAYCHLIQCLRHICKFISLDEMTQNKFKDIVFQQLTNNEVPCVSLKHSLLHNFESEELIQIASTFAKQYFNKPYVQRNSHRGYVYDIPIVSNSWIRIGYIYKDCSSHPSSVLLKSIRKFHDRDKFEVFFYSLSPINRLRSNNLSESDCCIDISNLSSIEAAKQINADGINILIDVGDSTKDLEYEIFALKPAPIQVKLLGHPGTSGAPFIDYLITDKKCSPPELDDLYTEKLAYLNRTVFFGDHGLLFNDLSQRNPQNRTIITNNSNETMGVFESYNTTSMYSVQILPDDSIKCYTRQMYNLPEDSIVYCYFGQLYKINQSTLNMWITILESVNNSVLWLLRFVKDAEYNIHEYVAMNGIDPARVIFSNKAPKDEHLRRIQLADIFLDTPSYNGHNSCLDALWAGIPIITLPGDTFASRMATSQLSALNCIETIAETEDEYITIAIKLGTFTHLLDQIRQQIWQSKTTSVLFDCKSYSKQLENLYLHMWNQFSN